MSGPVEGDELDVLLDRIARFEPALHAFAAFDEARVRADFARGERGGRLSGTLVAIKDVIDTVDYPTEYFSPIHAGRRPARDAWMVQRLRAEGATVIGKTHTAEFAYSHTGPTGNPHDLRRTPGSSSAGSAAGVAAGFFPLALGTQTAGSVLKPASYCGVYGFKPSFGRVPLDGVLAHAPSFDTAGWFARSIGEVALLVDVLMPGPDAAPRRTQGVLGWCAPPFDIEAAVANALAAARRELVEAGWAIIDVPISEALARVPEDHVVINEAEAVRSLAAEIAGRPDLISPNLAAAAQRVAERGPRAEADARERLRIAAADMLAIFERVDHVLAPTCGRVAPLGLEATGPSDHIRLWTAFGLPLLSMPLRRPPGELPVGLQLIGAPSLDRTMLDVAAQLAGALGVERVAPVDPH